jgi:hypothetical protein
MKSLTLFALAALLAPFVFAQTTSYITQKYVNSGAAQLQLYDIDHGSTAQAINLTINLTTNSNSGMRVTVIDIDEKSVMGVGAQSEGVKSGQGTLNMTHSLPSRTGVHPVLVIIQTHMPGTSDLNGQLDVSAGTILLANTNQSFRVQDGLFIPFGLYSAFNGEMTTQSSFSTNVTYDFGSTAHATTFVFRGEGSALNEIRLYDVTGGDVLLETLQAAPTTNNMDAAVFVTTPSYSGEVEFRIEVDGTGAQGRVFWATWIASDVTVVGGSGDGVPVPSSGNSGGDSGGGGCAASQGNAPWLLALLALMGAAGLRLRKRRAAWV